MNGRAISKEDEATLSAIVRSVDKKLDHSLREGSDPNRAAFTLHLARQGWEGNMILGVEDLQAAKSDLVCRNKIRQRIKRLRDHMWDNLFEKDVLGTQAARMLKKSGQGEDDRKRQFMPRRSPRR